ncbi:LuxR C-terminal-related transcriptional regulator [Falsiroseomonas sp.]|uniref:LuxR C-terminal-related transcriptional regulator n=1 Tax=Falsiroseomonas sp. TaxID=2870721 RepID=UPI003562A4EC
MSSRLGREAERFRILLMDEHALRRAALHQFLGSLGAEAGFALDVAQAASVEDAARIVGGAHVVLIGSGSIPEAMTLLAGFRESAPTIPTAVLSDHESAAEVVMALEGGARGVISTRIDPVLMLHALRFIAAGGHFFPPKALLGEASAPEPVPERGFTSVCALPQAGGGGLTSRQYEVLRLLQEGQSNKRIARTLGLRESTIKVHVRQIMRKLGVANRTQAALTAIRVPANDDGLVAA